MVIPARTARRANMPANVLYRGCCPAVVDHRYASGSGIREWTFNQAVRNGTEDTTGTIRARIRW